MPQDLRFGLDGVVLNPRSDVVAGEERNTGWVKYVSWLATAIDVDHGCLAPTLSDITGTTFAVDPRWYTYGFVFAQSNTRCGVQVAARTGYPVKLRGVAPSLMLTVYHAPRMPEISQTLVFIHVIISTLVVINHSDRPSIRLSTSASTDCSQTRAFPA
jgi:hypothetical protein